MDHMLTANRQGHIVCTQGGESLAGFKAARARNIVGSTERCVLDSTAHMLKFASFQGMYFEDSFPPDYEVVPRGELRNRPIFVRPEALAKVPGEGDLSPREFEAFVSASAEEIARILGLKKR